MKIIITIIFSYLISIPAFAEESYSCIGIKTVGFNVERKFNITKFTPHKWIIKRSNNNSWNVYEHDKSHPEMFCDDLNSDVFDKLKCDGLYGNLVMSKTTLRFVSSMYGQYIDDDLNTENIAIEIGECSKH